MERTGSDYTGVMDQLRGRGLRLPSNAVGSVSRPIEAKKSTNTSSTTPEPVEPVEGVSEASPSYTNQPALGEPIMSKLSITAMSLSSRLVSWST